MDHTKEIIREYLTGHGLTKDKVAEVTSGFDLGKAAYRNRIDKGSVIYQFVRRSSSNEPMPKIGNWFCLLGASMNKLAIMSGGEGREIAEIKVVIDMDVLEGTAAPQSVNWLWSGGGDGGNTQLYVPNQYLMTHIQVLGYRGNPSGSV